MVRFPDLARRNARESIPVFANIPQDRKVRARSKIAAQKLITARYYRYQFVNEDATRNSEVKTSNERMLPDNESYGRTFETLKKLGPSSNETGSLHNV